MPAGGGDQVGHGGAAAVQHPGHGGGWGHGALTTSTTLCTLLCTMYHHTLGVRGHPDGGVPGHPRHCHRAGVQRGVKTGDKCRWQH